MFPLVPQPHYAVANGPIQPGVYATVGVLLFLCILDLPSVDAWGPLCYRKRKAGLALVELGLAIATLIFGWWLIGPLLFLVAAGGMVWLVVWFVKTILEAVRLVFLNPCKWRWY